MKRALTLLCVLVMAYAAGAQTYSYLTIRQSDGTEQSLALSGLKLTFSNGSLQATNGTESATFAIAGLSSMYFATEATGLQAVLAPDAAATWQGGTLSVDAPAGSHVEVYTLSGQRVATYRKATNGAEKLGSRLPQGIYVVRVNGKSLKLIAR